MVNIQENERLKQIISTLEQKLESISKSDQYYKILLQFLRIGNKHSNITELLEDIISHIKYFTNCSSVGIRILDDDGNIPYKAYDGFSPEFIKKESILNIYNDFCLCIKVITGLTDNKNRNCTDKGSFYLNNLCEIIDNDILDKIGPMRNVCREFGFLSAALVPIRDQDRILGLIHIADMKKNKINKEKVLILENLGLQIGTAIQRILTLERYNKVQEDLIKTNNALSKEVEQKIALAQSLAEREKLYRTLIETMNDGLALTDCDGKFTFVNKKHAEILGYKKDELIGRKVIDLLDDRNKKIYFEQYDKRSKGETSQYEMTFKKNQGENIKVLISASPIYDEAGIFAGGLTVITDITERKLIEQKHLENERKLRYIIENMPVMMDALDKDMNIILWNKECERITGYRAEEMIGNLKAMELLYPDKEYRNEMMRKWKEIGDNYYGWEWEIVCKNGEQKTIAWSNISSLFPIAGWSTWGFGVDITDRIKASEDLKKSEALYRTLVETIIQGLITIDENLDITYVNNSLVDMLGYSREDFFEKHLMSFIHEDSHAMFLSEVENRKKGKIGHYEIFLVKKDGRELPVLVSVAPIFDKNKFKGSIAVITDLTHLKSAEDALKKSEFELKIRNEIASIFLTVSDDDLFDSVMKVVLKAFDSPHGLFGYIDENFNFVCPSLTQSVWEKCSLSDKNLIIPYKDLEGIWAKALKNKKSYYANTIFKTPSGHVPIQRAMAVPILHKKTLTGLFIVANREKDYENDDLKLLESIASKVAPILYERLNRDKLEKERLIAEKALLESEARYRTMFENINEGVAVYEAVDDGNDFKFKDYNQAGEKIDKMLREFIIGRRVTDIFPGIKDFGLLDVLKRVYKTGKSEIYPDAFYDDGRIQSWRENFIYKLPSGEIITVYRDTTQNHQIEEELRIKDTAINSSISGIAFMDLESRFMYVNRAGIQLLGCEDKNEILGQKATSLTFDIAKLKEVLKHLQTIGSWSGEISIRKKKNGTPSNIYMTANIVKDKEDKPICYMMAAMDITRLKHLQEQVIRSERLASTGKLAASIAHEINSPLQAIKVMLSSMTKKYDQDNELISNLDLLNQAFNNIKNTVKNLLDLNRPGTEQKQPMNLNVIIANTVSLYKSHLDKHKISINLDLDKKIPNIIASPQQIGHVIMNLINNSVDAMVGTSMKGERWKSREEKIREILIHTILMKENIIITISDNGPGIPEEDLDHVFDPFYTRKKAMGIGIGLSICHGIVEDHNGAIEVKNDMNGGAVFKITLPLTQ
jgi:PAS domain S-box-containing protein